MQLPDGRYEFIVATGSVTAVKGMIPAPRTPVSLEQMDAVIADAVTDRR